MAIPQDIRLDLGVDYPGTLVDKAGLGMGFTTALSDGTATPYIAADMEVATASSELSWLIPHGGFLSSGTLKNILAVNGEDLSKSHKIGIRISLPEARAYVAGSTTNGTQIGVMAAMGQEKFIKATLEIAPDGGTGYRWYIIGQTKTVINGTNTLTNIQKVDVHSLTTNTAYSYLDLELRYNRPNNKVSIWYKYENVSASLRADIFTPGADHIGIYAPNQFAAGFTRKNPNATNYKLQAKSFDLIYTHVEAATNAVAQPATTSSEAVVNLLEVTADVQAQPATMEASAEGSGAREVTANVQAQPATVSASAQATSIANADMYALPATTSASAEAIYHNEASGNSTARRATTAAVASMGTEASASSIAQPATGTFEAVNDAALKTVDANLVAQPASVSATGTVSSEAVITAPLAALPAILSPATLNTTHMVVKSKMQMFSNIQAGRASIRAADDSDNGIVISSLTANASCVAGAVGLSALVSAGIVTIDLTQEADILNTNDTPAYLIFSLENNQ